MGIKENLILVRKALNLSATDFAKAIDTTPANYGHIEAGRQKPTIEYLQRISSKFKVSYKFLIDGQGDIFLKSSYKEFPVIPAVASEPQAKYGINKSIPLIPMEALAGQGVGEFTIQDRDVVQRYVVPEFSKADFLIPVKGSSMYPKYYPGDIVACMNVPKGKFIEWNKAYVLDTTHGIMLKKILKSAIEGQWILRSENTEYQDIEVDPDEDIRHISKVIGVIRMV